MPRIHTPATIADAPAAAHKTLEAVNGMLGSVPNLFRIVANAPAALEGYIGLNSALGNGSLDPAARERIALAVAQVNDCSYCLAAHTYLAQNVAKLSPTEINRNRFGRSVDSKADVAVRFAQSIALNRGNVKDELFNEVKAAGYDDEQIVEIIAHVALNTLTNYMNEVLGTEVDFPAAANLES